MSSKFGFVSCLVFLRCQGGFDLFLLGVLQERRSTGNRDGRKAAQVAPGSAAGGAEETGGSACIRHGELIFRNVSERVCARHGLRIRCTQNRW